MLTGLWPSPTGYQEFALSFDQKRDRRVLVLPALLDEGNKLRHFTVEVMRRLDTSGIDCCLPDLPGMNESTAPLPDQTLTSWRESAKAAAEHFNATLVLAIRSGAMIDPGTRPALHYAPQTGKSLLRTLSRAQAMALKEAGNPVSREELLQTGAAEGVTLAGYDLGAAMVQQLLSEQPHAPMAEIAQAGIGGAGLWLRAEPAHDDDQADRLTELVLEQLA